MGIWGPGLYENDLALDMKQFVSDEIEAGTSSPIVAKKLSEAFSFAVGDEDDELVYWMTLADLQVDLGHLDDHVREKVLSYIEHGENSKVWVSSNPAERKARKKVLDALRKEIVSPVKGSLSRPKASTIGKKATKKNSAKWDKYEVYALPISAIGEKTRGYHGRYLIFHVLGRIFLEGKSYPRVRIKLSESTELPSDEASLNRAEFVQLSFCGMYRMSLLENTSAPSLTPVYQAMIFNTSSAYMPKNLIYLGSFPNLLPPSEEYVPNDLCIPGYAWKHMESHVLGDYQAYNLKKSSIFGNE